MKPYLRSEDDPRVQSIKLVNEYYRLAQNERNPSGFVLMDGKEVGVTKQCCHCNGHYLSRRGATRGFCLKCNGVTCGAPKCDLECVPFLKKLGEYEKGNRLILR